MRFPSVLCNIIMGYQGPYQMVAVLAGVDFFVILLQATEVVGKMPENGMEILSDVGKKVKKNSLHFFEIVHFHLNSARGMFPRQDLPASGSSRGCWLQVCSGCRGCSSQPHVPMHRHWLDPSRIPVHHSLPAPL